MRGLTFLVTGATGGLGSLVCRDLAARGATVIATDRRRDPLDDLVAELGDRARGVPSTALHPGTFLDTPMLAESGIQPLGTAQEGAEAILHVIDRTLEGVSGEFFDQRTISRADPLAYDLTVRDRLRRQTLAMLAPFWKPG